MGCSHLAAFVPRSFILASFVLLCVKTGVGTVDAGSCNAACFGDDCVTAHLDRADFDSAEETCRGGGGELMAFQSEGAESLLETLLRGAYGHLWIGLRLPSGVCSNLSAPLRGYQWTAGGWRNRSFLPSSSAWKEGVEVCSPRCVSLSGDRKWTERPCSDQVDGFLCKTNHQNACQAQGLSDPHIFVSAKGCSHAPCEHRCTEVRGGYICSCFDRFVPNSQEPHMCELHCPTEQCPVLCDGTGSCFCPEGFVRSEDLCVDIDECQTHCDQVCVNSFGSFTCSCWEGFKLNDEGRCVQAGERKGSTITPPVVTTAVNGTLKVSPTSTGTFLWIWICIAVAVVVCIFVLRYCVVKRQERREYTYRQRPSSHVDNVEI